MPVSFTEFIRLCKRIAATSSINEKTTIIASFLSRIDKGEWKPLIMLLAGKAVPETKEGGLGIGFSLVKKALKSGVKPLLPPPPPTVSDVYQRLHEIADVRGPGSMEKKVMLLSSLFNSLSTDEEMRWLAKIIFGELRIGVEEGHILNALSRASSVPLEYVRRAYMLRGSLDELIELLNDKDHDIRDIKPVIFKPIRPMLATPANSISEAFSLIGGGEAAVEVKYDGARVQIHVKNDRVKIFSRRLTDVSGSLPEIIERVKNTLSNNVGECILEGEVIAVKEGRPLPFQELMKRFRRVKDIESVMVEIPIQIFFFEIIYVDGKLLIDQPYVDRYSILERIVSRDLLAERIVTSDIDEAEEFFKKALKAGHEGVMVKRLDAPYILGSRGKNWIKVKSAESVDLVIVGAEWGHGRRRKWLSDYYLAAYNPDTGGYELVGKTFKGLTDEEFQYMTSRLLEIVVRDEGYRVWVKPEIVVEVAFNEIQKSPKYRSGLALRLARITRLREDKSPSEATTIHELRLMYERQFRYKGRAGDV